MNILITNGNSRMALCIARSCSQSGHNVFVGDYIKHYMCSYSNKVKVKAMYPSPYSFPEEFIKWMIEFIKLYKIDIVIPVHEESFLISKKEDELKAIVSLGVPKYEKIIKVHNKSRLYELLCKLSIRTPKTLNLSEFKNYNDIKLRFEDKIILKPRQGGGNWALFVPDVQGDLNKQINEYLSANKINPNRILVQELIPVENKYSHVVVYQNGKLINDFSDIHIRDYPLKGGAGVLRISCDSSKMKQISIKIFDYLQWHGLAEVEFVTHAVTKEFYLIEINPRVWGGVNSAISSGFDIPTMLIDLAIGNNISPISYKKNVQTRWFWGDIKVFSEYLRTSKDKKKVIKEYLKLMFDNTKTDEFFWDDPIPFFIWPMHVLHKILKYKSLRPAAYDSLSGEWK